MLQTKSRFLLTTFVFFTVLCVLTYFFGYYEEYEAYFISMLGGKLTPGYQYDNLYYYGQVGLSFIYSFLYKNNPDIPWIPIIYNFVLSLSFLLFLRQIGNRKSKHWAILSFCFVFLLLIEHILIINITRISFMVVGLNLLTSIHLNKIDKTYYLCQALAIFGVLTRIESATIVLLILVFSQLSIALKLKFWDIVKTLTVHLGLSALLIASISLYFHFDFQNSKEFYKAIEPDVEYELMVNQNFNEIPKMSDSISYMRFKAIEGGYWGDSETNTNKYLRSLINTSPKKVLHNQSLETLIELSKKNWPLLLMLTLSIFLHTLTFGYKSVEFRQTIIFILLSFFVLFFIAFKIKMVDRGFSTFLLLLNLILFLQIIKKKIAFNRFIYLFLVISILQFFQSYSKINALKSNYEDKKNVYNRLQIKLENKPCVFLGKQSIDVFFHSQRPFGKQNYLTNTYVFNALAFITIQPYKSYLTKKWRCNPNDYLAFFKRFTTTECYFLITQEEIEFIENYMRIVHDFPIEFEKTMKIASPQNGNSINYICTLKRLHASN
jgi:hypothetical protein